MTRQNPWTRAAIERAIKAALAAGLDVTGVRPDGTVLTEKRDNCAPLVPGTLTPQPQLRDARQRLLNG